MVGRRPAFDLTIMAGERLTKLDKNAKDHSGIARPRRADDLHLPLQRSNGQARLLGRINRLWDSLRHTEPQKTSRENYVTPQADPNGLFSPASAEGTWILLKDPNGKDVCPATIIFPSLGG
jgi:hypothetical protein